MKFVPAVAYHLYLNLPASFLQPRTKKFSQLCSMIAPRSEKLSASRMGEEMGRGELGTVIFAKANFLLKAAELQR